MKLNKELIDRIEEITLTDFGFNENGETEYIYSVIEELVMAYDNLLDEYNDYKEHIRDNY